MPALHASGTYSSPFVASRPLAVVVLRDSLPRNPNGKILKRELRAEYVRT